MTRKLFGVFVLVIVAIILVVLILPSSVAKVKFLAYQQSNTVLNNMAGIPFAYIEIDSQELGLKEIGDINGDGFADIMVRNEAEVGHSGIAWYEYPIWEQHVIAASENYRSDDIELADVDSDNDLDVVVVLDEPGKVYWYENPRPAGSPANLWSNSHYIGLTDDGPEPDSYVKDLEVDDFTGDGKLDVVVRTHNKVFVFRQDTPSSWTQIQAISIHAHEGMDVGDLDHDGDPDVVLNGFWLETPDDPVNDTWLSHNIDSKWWNQTDGGSNSWQNNNTKIHVSDLNNDGNLDVLICHSEKPDYPVSWYEATDPKTGPWMERPITDTFDYCHTLKAADINNDGALDVVAAEMPKSDDPDEIVVFVNEDNASTWSKQVVATVGSYSAQVGDIGNDGDIDIVGTRNWDSPPLEMWENKTNDPLDNWTYIQVDNHRAKWGDFDAPAWLKYFGLAMGDLTGDGYKDIVSGRYFYRNPGGDMAPPWSRVDFGLNVDAMAIVDVDRDELGDVIGEALPNVYWLEATDKQGNSWDAIQIGTLPAIPGHVNGQGYGVAQIIDDGKPEIILAGGEGDIYFLEIPTDPAAGNWPYTLITSDSNTEGVGIADIDGDGHLDITAADMSGGDRIAWWKNPGDKTETWQKYKIGDTDGQYPDRMAVADLNGDGRPDVVVTEEEQPVNPDYKTYWFEQPVDPTSSGWPRRTIVTQYTTNSLDVADMDQDGDIDIITGEHRGTKKVAVWENVNLASSWVEHIVSEGKESHLGARIADLDGDNDMEIISIAWDDYQYLHLWRNNAPLDGG